MFYNVETSSACDICEGSECAEKCAPKAQPQVSQKQEVDPNRKGDAIFATRSDGNRFVFPSILSLVAVGFLRSLF